MKIVIIGAGPAGVSVAETFRAYDQQAELVMLSAEPYLPYSPPAMADHFTNGSDSHLWKGTEWLEQYKVEYHSGVIVATIRPDDHQIDLQAGGSLAYDRLVIATGSRLYAPLAGVELQGVYNFKSLSAAEELIHRVKSSEGGTVVVIGAGFIGMEIALLLCDLGVKVIQVEMLDQVMSAMLDASTAKVALELMRERGIDIRLQTKAVALLGDQRAEVVEMETGEVIDADFFIAATGVKPHVELLEGSGIAYGWGIIIDDHLRTNAPDVYAAGDVIEAPDRLTGERYVHAIFPNAVEQGHVVGLNLAGFDCTYSGAERMNSLKHLGLPILAAGLKQGDEVLQVERDGNLRTLYLQENRLVGYQLVGDIHPAGIFRTLLLQARDVRPIKDYLLSANFGQGHMAWNAMGTYA